jgi:predicted RNA-binding protein
MFSYWLVVGIPGNWQTAFEHGNIWGLKETQRHLWERLQENDMLLFYATSPVGGVIGYGTVRTKFRQNQPLWPKEIEEKKLIWPLRFEFDVEYCLPPDKWTAQKVISRDLWPRVGFQGLSKDMGERLVYSIRTSDYGVQIPKPTVNIEPQKEYMQKEKRIDKGFPSHDDVKEVLVEIGRLQNFIAESEYQFELGKLDVVWRRVQHSVPTYVFEIQIGGNLYQALVKLKHAFDLWNSHVFIVSPQEDFSKVLGLLSGTFHEIQDRLKFIDCLQVKELFARKKSYHQLEKELGII